MNPSADDLINKIVLLQEYNSSNTKRYYRFSDVINHLGYYWKESTEFISKQDHLKDKILRKYIERCPDHNLISKNSDYVKLLYDIVQTKITSDEYTLATDDELVIHLRIGDVLDFGWFLQKDYVGIIQNYIDNYNIKKVTFCTAFQYGNNVTNNLWIYTDEKNIRNVNKLRDLFTKVLTKFKDLHFDVKSSQNIDDDFIYMVMAKYFVEDNGGITKIVKEVHTYKEKIELLVCSNTNI